jgi:hypothetical protein
LPYKALSIRANVRTIATCSDLKGNIRIHKSTK